METCDLNVQMEKKYTSAETTEVEVACVAETKHADIAIFNLPRTMLSL